MAALFGEQSIGVPAPVEIDGGERRIANLRLLGDRVFTALPAWAPLELPVMEV